MEQLIWETAEKLDQKLAKRVRDMADELRNIFTQVPYRNIQEVINETK